MLSESAKTIQRCRLEYNQQTMDTLAINCKQIASDSKPRSATDIESNIDTLISTNLEDILPVVKHKTDFKKFRKAPCGKGETDVGSD